MKNFFLTVIFILLIAGKADSQISKIIIGVDGFTCSLCAKGVEGQFKSLDFVKSVKTDLKKTEFTIYFRSKTKVDISQIRDAVYDGGFSVRDIKIDATGSISGNSAQGYSFMIPDLNSISLKDVTGNFKEGEKVILQGKVNTGVTFINVTSIKKL